MFALVFSPVTMFGAAVSISEITPDFDCELSGFAVADLYTDSNTTSDFVITCEIDSNHSAGVKVVMGTANAGHFFNSNGDKFTPVNYGVVGASFQANDADLHMTGVNTGYTLTPASNTISLAANNLNNLYQPVIVGSAVEIFRVVPNSSEESLMSLGTATADNLILNFEANWISTDTTTLQYKDAASLIAGTYADTVTLYMTQLGGTNVQPVTQNIDLEE